VGRALDGVVDRMIALRRDVVAHPELAWHEVRTSALVTHELVHAGLATPPCREEQV
jgi:metal-dependent amidase/aminoacylase/carboxypeptidase family protein